MNYPRVCVLVLSYNGKHLLPDALSSYLANGYPNFEVVVIDNGSVDGTLEFVSRNYPQAKVVRTEKNLGYSGGLNLGLSHAFRERGADYALVTNNDVRVDHQVISELVKVAERDSQIGFVTGKVYYYEKPNVLQTVGKWEDKIKWNGEHIGRGEVDNGQYDEISERYFIDDVFTLVRRKLYEDTGGYDTTFFLEAEEYDWQARAKKLGYKIMYTPHARLWHKESMTIGRISPLKTFYDARNPMLVILLHKSPEYFRRYFWFHFKKDILRSALASIKHGDMALASARLRGFCSGICWGVQNRKFTWKHFVKST
jgi:GT2 family glycosyltransferase